MKRGSALFTTALLALIPLVLGYSAHAETKKLDKTPPEHLYMKEKQQAPPVSHQDVSALSGKVVETMNSGGYTYLCIEKDGKKTWAAILETKVAVGQEIALQPGYEMVNFASKTLNRTFDKIIFSTGPASQEGTVDVKSFHGKTAETKTKEAAPAEKIQVEKASAADAYTVAELYGKKAELDTKNVTVRGKVVKVSSGIMGRNWLHVQDGTGNQQDGSNDLVVTSKDLAAVGDVVTISGTLYKDKDFGSGYKYDVIVEQASIKK
ncbi:MAG: DNA-binding protein [Candidatus Brocadia sp.]|jgi:hypothetical protein|uniref:DNA-binding protein n=1 Tax=Candidatus Brocadia fulgida TaxID=380242 RepID=A0A0M2V2D7_9BACT|nr:MAG: hypothetical protein BROFUL_00400 [Candidatus Brocadia fulgida]OQZ02871.1 MAG: DNA-binding protein [Candidatus Brocadia sp. UTAMX2]UJS20792.1 MAG: DNA-binding protein [Candidatus Brocadia sp.]